MRITLEQFQTDFVTGLDSVVVGAEWLQQMMRNHRKLQTEYDNLVAKEKWLIRENSKLKNRVLSIELADKNIYILDTLA